MGFGSCERLGMGVGWEVKLRISQNRCGGIKWHRDWPRNKPKNDNFSYSTAPAFNLNLRESSIREKTTTWNSEIDAIIVKIET